MRTAGSRVHSASVTRAPMMPRAGSEATFMRSAVTTMAVPAEVRFGYCL